MSSNPNPLPSSVRNGEVAVRNEWFEAEVAPHGTNLKAWLRGKYPDVRDVEDVVQESYLRVWRTTAPIQSAKAFLYKVARHIALDWVRRERRSPFDRTVEIDLAGALDGAPNAAEVLLGEDLFREVVEALLLLPEKQRAVVMLHWLKGLPLKSVANELGLTERTAQKYSSIGLEAVSAHLTAKGISGFFGS